MFKNATRLTSNLPQNWNRLSQQPSMFMKACFATAQAQTQQATSTFRAADLTT